LKIKIKRRNKKMASKVYLVSDEEFKEIVK
jgi:hypothetical protein